MTVHTIVLIGLAIVVPILAVLLHSAHRRLDIVSHTTMRELREHRVKIAALETLVDALTRDSQNPNRYVTVDFLVEKARREGAL